MNIYEEFLMNSLVVRIDSIADVALFVKLMQEKGISRIRDFYATSKGNYDWMLNNYPLGELCIEYQMGKGFTISGAKDNLAYGNKVISFDEFKETLTVRQLLEKKRLPIFDEVEQLPDDINLVIKFTGINNKTEVEYVSSITPNYMNGVYTKKYARKIRTKKTLIKYLNYIYDCGYFDHYEFELENTH